AASPTSLFSCTKSPKRAPCRTRSSLDRVGDLQRRRHGRLAGLDRRRRRARFAERHRFHARLDGNWTAGRRGGDDALQPHAEPARDALGLGARIGPGLLERAAQQRVLLRDRDLGAPTPSLRRALPAAASPAFVAAVSTANESWARSGVARTSPCPLTTSVRRSPARSCASAKHGTATRSQHATCAIRDPYRQLLASS